MAGDTTLDEVTAAFANAMESIDRLAEIENAVFRLAREVRKTQRRVNALEKMFIPSYVETLRFITDALEERERDEFIVMRKVKERLQKRH
jgi:V/A-type H+-transporting ATPase subunit D